MTFDGREIQMKLRSFARFAVHGDGAIVALDDSAHDCETEPRSAARRFRGEERFEDSLDAPRATCRRRCHRIAAARIAPR